MKLSGKQAIIKSLREEADNLREWMLEHCGTETSAAEFEKVANRYAIICTKVSVIEKQW